MARIAYYRTSSDSSSIESQRNTLGNDFDCEFIDPGVSGAIPAAKRPAFAEMLAYVRDRDEISVFAVDRLGRDALDVQATVRALLEKGVTVNVHGLGQIGRGAGELILAVLAQVADMERIRIKERCDAGRKLAAASLAEHGVTHRGKTSLGRPKAANASEVVEWRRDNRASIAQTAKHFDISTPTVKRYCAANAA
jgi:putative DNA-invertase from lambdoid prophage Rac